MWVLFADSHYTIGHLNEQNVYIKFLFTVPIGLSKYGGIEPQVGITQLQAALFQEEIAEEILKPVKETVSAGKSLFGWGRSFTNWMSRLVHWEN